MDRETAEGQWQKRRAEISKSLDDHIAALGELDRTTGFNFDVATDVHPAILYDTADGVNRLKFWQNIYANLAMAPTYTVIKYYATGLEDKCYGMGHEPDDGDYKVTGVRYIVFKDLAPDDISFIKAGEGDVSKVYINHSSHNINFVNSRNSQPSLAAQDTDEPTLLFKQTPAERTQEDWVSWANGYMADVLSVEEPEFFFAATLNELAENTALFTGRVGNRYGEYLPGGRLLDEYIRRESAENSAS